MTAGSDEAQPPPSSPERSTTFRSLALVAVVLVSASIAWNAFQAIHEGWVAEGDAAIISIRTHDVLTAHPPLLGNPTTAGSAAQVEAYHPGPLEFVLLAVPLRLFGPSTDGLVAGSALVNIAAVVALAWFAFRRAGSVFAIWAMFVTAVLLWGLGNEIPHDPYNPHIVLVPMLLLLVLVWSIACGDLVAVPAAVFAGSLIAQSHVYDALLVAALALFALGCLCVQLRSGTLRRLKAVRWIGGSVLLGIVLWLPPIISEIAHRPGNAQALLRSSRAPDSRGEGISFALRRLVDAVSPPWRWLDGQPTYADLHGSPGVVRGVTAVAILAVMAVLTAMVWRARRRTTALLLVVGLLGLVASTMVAARLPQGLASSSPYNHRHWWATAAFAMLALGWGLAEIVRTRGLSLTRHRAKVAGAALVATAMVVFAMTAHVTIRDDRGSASFGAISNLTGPLVAAVQSHHRVVVVGLGAQAFTSIEPGLVAALILHGIDARVLPSEGHVYGARHVADASIDTWVYIVSGPGAESPPVSGTSLVAAYNPEADVRRGFINAGVSGSVEPIAVYVGPPDPARSIG